MAKYKITKAGALEDQLRTLKTVYIPDEAGCALTTTSTESQPNVRMPQSASQLQLLPDTKR
jgi:hypothetical protein